MHRLSRENGPCDPVVHYDNCIQVQPAPLSPDSRNVQALLWVLHSRSLIELCRTRHCSRETLPCGRYTDFLAKSSTSVVSLESPGVDGKCLFPCRCPWRVSEQRDPAVSTSKSLGITNQNNGALLKLLYWGWGGCPKHVTSLSSPPSVTASPVSYMRKPRPKEGRILA